MLVLNGNDTFNGYCKAKPISQNQILNKEEEPLGGLDFIMHDLKKVLVDDGFDVLEFTDDAHCKKKELVRVCITHAIFKILRQQKINDELFDSTKYLTASQQLKLLKETKDMY